MREYLTKAPSPNRARPNLTVKRTYPGGAHLRARQASGAPAYAAYLLR
jgi:hypothetical protein